MLVNTAVATTTLEQILGPPPENVHRWLLESLRHVNRVEYFLNLLNVGNNDPERPHDMVGQYSKFDWDVIKYLARQYENEGAAATHDIVQEGIRLHRQQYHHRMWNAPDPNAPEDALDLGAVDTKCNYLEGRGYNQHDLDSYEKIEGHFGTHPDIHPTHRKHVLKMLPGMRELKQPETQRIVSLVDFPNIGLPPEVYQRIQERMAQTLQMLQIRHRYAI